MRVLVIGYAENVLDDMARVDIKAFDKVIVVNKAITLYPASDVWITLHPEKLQAWDLGTWTEKPRVVSFARGQNQVGDKITYTVDEEFPYLFEGQSSSGSSGLYAVKYALEVLGATEVLLAGIPMDEDQTHLDDATAWIEGKEFWQTWVNMAEFLRSRNVRSLSGRTRDLLE